MALNISGMIYCHGEEFDLISNSPGCCQAAPFRTESIPLHLKHGEEICSNFFPSNSTEIILHDNYKIYLRVSEVGINLQNCEMETCNFLYSTSREI